MKFEFKSVLVVPCVSEILMIVILCSPPLWQASHGSASHQTDTSDCPENWEGD